MSVSAYMLDLGKQARQASRILALATTKQKNTALLAIADALDANRQILMEANQQDVHHATQKGLDAAMLDRLRIDDKAISAMIESLQQIATLPDPIGAIDDMRYRPSGIQIGKMRVPLGVIGIIYESRPNVTVDAASLCLKSGNAVILRGGSEAQNSNQAIAACVTAGLLLAELPEFSVQMVNTPDRSAVGDLITMHEYVDVIVPRGGKGLISRISQDASIPVIKHLDGNCHVYLDDQADATKAINIAINAKTRRYGVCNAMETLLVAASRAQELLSQLSQKYYELGVELRVCPLAMEVLGSHSQLKLAIEEDWYEEYLAPILAIKVVDDMSTAIEHINQYGSHHTDAIVTENLTQAKTFMAQVDSSSVIVNASTSFADGFEYGLGAEIGISTDKIHARGPVGLLGLTSQKYIVLGDGHIRD